MAIVRVGKRGAIILPTKLRNKFGIQEGKIVNFIERPEGILIRSTFVLPVEIYSPKRKAEFLLSTATTSKDYRKVQKEVSKLGLDLDSISKSSRRGKL